MIFRISSNSITYSNLLFIYSNILMSSREYIAWTFNYLSGITIMFYNNGSFLSIGRILSIYLLGINFLMAA
jgi:hypothetical protein